MHDPLTLLSGGSRGFCHDWERVLTPGVEIRFLQGSFPLGKGYFCLAGDFPVSPILFAKNPLHALRAEDFSYFSRENRSQRLASSTHSLPRASSADRGAAQVWSSTAALP